MTDEFVMIDDVLSRNIEYGKKAIMLNKLAQTTDYIPDGFLLSNDQVKNISLGHAAHTSYSTLQNKFERLKDNSCSRKIIVRSSSAYEDHLGKLCAGIFESYDNVQSFDDFLAAIKGIFTSGNSQKFKRYFEDIGSKLGIEDHMGIAVQEWIECEIYGLAYVDLTTALLEIFPRELQFSTKGTHEARQTILFKRNIRNDCEILFELGDKYFAHNDLVINIFDVAQATYGNKNSLIEFGILDEKLYIFQVRPTHNIKYGKSKIGTHLVNKDKSSAMTFFSENSLFNRKLSILECGVKADRAKKILMSTGFSEDDTLTIRYSDGNIIGLPRNFVKGISEAIKDMQSNNSLERMSIVHEYININRSFELLLDEDGWLLEHIPGLWESDNELQPDAIQLKNDIITIWRYKRTRLAKFQNVYEINYINDEPCDIRLLEKWAYKAKLVASLLRKKLHEELPVNIHFVEDENDSWQFLNLRPIHTLEANCNFSNDTHVISEVDDLEKWDKKSTLVLSVSVNRGDEFRLLALGKALPKDITIYVDFGILSHPAMVLREYGCNLLPSYLLHYGKMNSEFYDNYTVIGDLLLEPYDRIMLERPILTNSYYHFVKDREQISDSHILVVAKEKAHSIADTKNLSELYKGLNLVYGASSNCLMYFERGRANFCTSGFTTKQAHAHIFLETEYAHNTIPDFAFHTNSIWIETLQEALSIAQKSKDEYLIFGSDSKGFYLKVNFHADKFDKRLIRSFLSQSKL